MAAIGNDPARCEVLNLGWAENGHGPYLVRQEGHAPGSSDLQPRHFILQKDGRWLLNLAFVMLPDGEQERQLFTSLPEAAAFLDTRSDVPPVVDDSLPPGADLDEIMRRFEHCANRLLRGMRDGRVIRIS